MDLPIRKLGLIEGWSRVVEMKLAGELPMDYPGPTPMMAMRKPEDIAPLPRFRHVEELPIMGLINVKGIEDVVHHR